MTAPGPVPKKNFDPKPFSVGHMGPNLSFHTPFTPLPYTFLVILVKRMTLKKNLPPPALNRVKLGLSLAKWTKIPKIRITNIPFVF